MLLACLFLFYRFGKLGAKLWDGDLSWIWYVRAVTMVNIFEDYVWISSAKFLGYISVKEPDSGLK